MTKIMREEFLEHIRSNKLFNPDETVLLSVSGGIDSMVMAELFLREGFNVSVAHINHQLRGDDSLKDAEFVRSFCITRNVTFHIKDLDPEELHTGNMQSNARIARYSFLKDIAFQHGYDKIATAHTMDDNVETFFINTLRGTGLNGLDGIPVISGHIIRPLLFASRANIETYATLHSVSYREDASNQSLKYTRNKIRLQLIPVIKQMDARHGKGILQTLQNLKQDNELLSFLIRESTHDWMSVHNDYISMDLHKIIGTGHGKSILRYILLDYGYNSVQVAEIIEQKDKSGLLFYSATHELLIDRGHILIRNIHIQATQPLSFVVKNIPYQIKMHLKSISLEVIDYFPGIDISGPHQYLDYEKLTLPLVLRSWQPGDTFQPLGMKGRQKVKKFLTNRKMDRFSKEETVVVADQSNVVAIVGHQISEKVKINNYTKKLIKIQVEPMTIEP